MLRCQFLCHVLKALFFIKIVLKLSDFCKKCKIFKRWGLRLQTTLPPKAGAFAPRPPVSSIWGLCPQSPKTATPVANFWPRAWVIYCLRKKPHCLKVKAKNKRQNGEQKYWANKRSIAASKLNFSSFRRSKISDNIFKIIKFLNVVYFR